MDLLDPFSCQLHHIGLYTVKEQSDQTVHCEGAIGSGCTLKEQSDEAIHCEGAVGSGHTL